VFYDDQSNPSTVPGIYTKLIDVDKVNLVVSGYATNMVAPAMPVVMQKNKVFPALFALDAKRRVQVSKILLGAAEPGPTPRPRYRRLLHVWSCADSETDDGCARGGGAESPATPARARENAKKFNLKIVYDKSYPPSTTDFTPIVRALQASNADLVVICSYPLSSVGMVNTINELKYQPKMIGGAMVGLQATVVQAAARRQAQWPRQLRNLGAVGQADGAGRAFFDKYQARAGAEGVDPLGYYLGGWGYAYLSALGQAIEGAKSIEDDKVADYYRKTPSRRSWATGLMAQAVSDQVQHHAGAVSYDIKEGETWKGMN